MSNQENNQDISSMQTDSLSVSIEPQSLEDENSGHGKPSRQLPEVTTAAPENTARSAAPAADSTAVVDHATGAELKAWSAASSTAAITSDAAVPDAAASPEGAAQLADSGNSDADADAHVVETVDTQSAAGSARIILTRLISDVQKDTEVSLSDDGQDDVASAVLGLDDEPVDERTAVARILADGAARAAAASEGSAGDGADSADSNAGAAGWADNAGRGFTPHYVEEGPELSQAELDRYNRMMLKEGDNCPACGNGRLVLRKNERISFLGCSCYPACKMRYFTSHLSAVTVMRTLESLCPDCNSPLAVKKGRYGLFIGCTSYPDCNYTYREEDTVEEISCPSCMGGQLERRRARSGRTFYGCNSWPECDFIVPGVPVVDECPDCGFPVRYKKKVKAGTALMCANPLCSSRRRRRHNIIAS